MLHRRRTLGVAAAALGLLVAAFGAQEAEAQRGGRGGGFRGPQAMRGAAPTGVERAIRLADELELSADQRTQLEGLRLELVELNSGQAVRAVELGSEVRAGLVEPEALRQQMQELRSVRQESAEAARDRLEGLLTEDQMDEFTEMARQGRGQRGFRGRGDRSGRDFRGRRGSGRRGPGV